MLTPYRVLDLTDHRGEIAGMILADLGADVVKVEPPGGSSARRCEPRLSSGPEAERSLQFFAYNRNKRSIALDLASGRDRDTFLRLVENSDFVLESGNPGPLAAQELGFEILRAANSRIVHVQITPFGTDGPRANWVGSDLVLAAMGGPVALQGVAERPPVRVSVPQAWRHTGGEAAVAALVGHARMRRTGEAQFIDVSAQCAMTWTLLNAMDTEAIQGHDFKRFGSMLQLGGVTLPLVFECADGYVVLLTTGAAIAAVVPWMVEEGVVEAEWAEEDWLSYDRRFQFGEPVAYAFEDVIDALQRWLRLHPKDKLLRRGLEAGVSFAPVNTIGDALAFDHLEARDFWAKAELPDGSSARAPGVFARPSAVALRAPPKLDEHGAEIRAELASATPKPLEPKDPGEFPFSGLKVADFSWVGVGPISARYLADHGATVVRVESESRPDVLRVNGPFKDGTPGINRSQFFGDFNTSKLGLQLDLKRPAAQEVARRLIAWADVYIESFTPGTVDDLGIGYETARELNPSIVMVSTCLMGQTGPAASFAGYGYHAGAVAGFYEVTGWPDLRPDGPWVAYTDTIAPRFVAATLMAAIDHCRRTGKGQHIDGAQLEMGLQFLAPEILEYQVSGEQVTRIGNRSRHLAPQGVYRCVGDDEWCSVAVDTDAEWTALCDALGRSDWSSDPALASAAGRLARHDELDAGIEAWTDTRTPLEAAEALQAAGVPAGMAQLSHDLLLDPQYAHRGFYRYYEHGEMGRIPYAGHQFRIRGYDSGPRGPAPLIGEHLHEVLSGLLGMNDEEISEAISGGALG